MQDVFYGKTFPARKLQESFEITFPHTKQTKSVGKYIFLHFLSLFSSSKRILIKGKSREGEEKKEKINNNNNK